MHNEEEDKTEVPEKMRRFAEPNAAAGDEELLPVKVDGRLVRRYKPADELKKEGDNRSSEDEDDEGDNEMDINLNELVDSDSDADQEAGEGVAPQEDYSHLSAQELLARRNTLLKEAKLKIASTANLLVNDPQENVMKLHSLYRLSNGRDEGAHPLIGPTVQKLAIASMVEVFLSILPGYQIRPLSEEEQKQQMKMETRKLIHFEHTLLEVYHKYLQLLQARATELLPRPANFSKKSRALKQPHDAKLSTVCVKCLCKLLDKASHSNYATDVIVSLVRLCASSTDPEVLQEICRTLSSTFREDISLEMSLHGTKAVADFVHVKKTQMAPELLYTLLSLNIKEVSNSVGASDASSGKKWKRQKFGSDQKRESRKMKKDRKRKLKLEAPLREAEAEEQLSSKLKTATETMKHVFTTYFRVLRRMPSTALLPPVLEGLAKFAHLINVEFFDDLVSSLGELVEQKHLKVSESLHCIKTVCVILSGEGQALNIDPIKFYTTLFGILPSLAFQDVAALDIQVPLVVDCLEMLLIKRRRLISLNRVAAFVKRLLLLSLLLPNRHAAVLLASVRTLFIAHSGLNGLVDTGNEEAVANGVFRADSNDPDCSNSLCTDFIPELTLLSKHRCQIISAFAKNLLNQVPSSGPLRLRAQWSNMAPKEWLGSEEVTAEESPLRTSIAKFCKGKRLQLTSKNVCSTLGTYLAEKGV